MLVRARPLRGVGNKWTRRFGPGGWEGLCAVPAWEPRISGCAGSRGEAQPRSCCWHQTPSARQNGLDKHPLADMGFDNDRAGQSGLRSRTLPPDSIASADTLPTLVDLLVA